MTSAERTRLHEVLVAVATFRRAADLDHLLQSLEPVISRGTNVVVVDNDPEGSARDVVDRHRGVRYDHEPQPGIAAARNRGLRAFAPEFTYIVFVDDDEWVGPDWLDTLIATSEDLSADVVQGPVLPVLAENAPAWIVKGGFFQRARSATGTSLVSAATNNTLLRRDAWVRAGSPSFDEGFSVTGGSDWDFFWLIRSKGARIVYCDEAPVWEKVPHGRMNFRWLRRRAMRKGIVRLRVLRKHGERTLPPTVKSTVRGLYSFVLLGGNMLFRWRVSARRFEAAFQELGFLSGLAGHRINEYARLTGSTNRPST